ncbi:MAG: FliH/SctL family protein, partial [Vulcanimicrobiaceae bacterium]
RALARYFAEEPLRVRVHPDDAAALRDAPIAVEADPRLRRGDAAVDLRNGTVDASLGVRLDDAVRALAGA